jgi:hypothetical protein
MPAIQHSTTPQDLHLLNEWVLAWFTCVIGPEAAREKCLGLSLMEALGLWKAFGFPAYMDEC